MSDVPPTTLIAQACEALFAPRQVVELRCLGLDGRGNKTASGWYDDPSLLVAHAANVDAHRKPEGVYVTLNPVHDGCLARSALKLKDWCKITTSDRDVIRRYWLPIDIDPVRPAGVSSTDAELEAARLAARGVAAWLEGDFGWPPGVRGFSGNGIHLLYRVDLPNDDAAKDVIAACLAAIHVKHSGPAVKIDTGNINAARIWKLYGTTARKGESLPDRPHRRSRLLTREGSLPTFVGLGVATPAQLEALAALAPGRHTTPTSTRSGRGGGSNGTASKAASVDGTPDNPAIPPIVPCPMNGEYAVDLDHFIAAYNLPVVRCEAFDGTGRKYLLARCLFDETHTGTSACIGRSRSGRIFYRCFHDSCSDKNWDAVKALYRGEGDGNQGPAVTAVKPSRRRDSAGTDGSGGTRKPSGSDVEPWALAQALIGDELTDADTQQVTVRRHREVWYSYDARQRRYRAVPDDAVRVLVTRWLGDQIDKVSNKVVSDVINCLAAILTAPHEIDLPFLSRIDPETRCSTGDPAARNWITLRNGILDLDAILDGQEIREALHCHTPEWFSVTSLPFPFPVTEEQAECPTWQGFLMEIFQGDEARIELLQEAFGYCFLKHTGIEAFFVMFGPGRNGKSTVLNVLRSLLGVDNVSSLSVEQFSEGTLIGQLAGKLANLCADMNEMDKVQEGLLKAIVSGDLITTDRKYKDALQFRPTCKLFFATNVLPRFVDTSLGIWRRMQLIPFDFIVPPEDIDVYLYNKLEAELPGIFWWALQGMLRLRENSRFTTATKCTHALRAFRLACFPILLFMEECTNQDETATITAGELWRVYRRWCDAVGLKKPKPLHSFVKDVLGFRSDIEYCRPVGGMESNMTLTRIGIRPDATFDDPRNAASQQNQQQELTEYWQR